MLLAACLGFELFLADAKSEMETNVPYNTLSYLFLRGIRMDWNLKGRPYQRVISNNNSDSDSGCHMLPPFDDRVFIKSTLVPTLYERMST